MPKIVHFRRDCIGCNSCAEYASDYWEIIEKDGKALLKRSTKKGDTNVLDISDFELAENLLAAGSCPMGIIHILDDQGKRLG
ncbi:MAG: ferredoxin [Candidatus Buchananbacteria bacterium]|nr:ferredoxin [Candidatus Buchananbacteria bacterium]